MVLVVAGTNYRRLKRHRHWALPRAPSQDQIGRQQIDLASARQRSLTVASSRPSAWMPTSLVTAVSAGGQAVPSGGRESGYRLQQFRRRRSHDTSRCATISQRVRSGTLRNGRQGRHRG